MRSTFVIQASCNASALVCSLELFSFLGRGDWTTWSSSKTKQSAVPVDFFFVMSAFYLEETLSWPASPLQWGRLSCQAVLNRQNSQSWLLLSGQAKDGLLAAQNSDQAWSRSLSLVSRITAGMRSGPSDLSLTTSPTKSRNLLQT